MRASAAAVRLCLAMMSGAAALQAAEFRVTPDMPEAEINKCVSRMRFGDRMVFAKGEYLLKRHIYVGGRRNVVFEGENGAVLKMHCNPAGSEKESAGGFFIDNCERVLVRNLRLTTDNPIGCQGTVVGKDPDGNALRFLVDPGFPVTGREHYFQLNTVDGEGNPDGALGAHVAIHKVDGPEGTEGRYVGMDYELIGERLVRIGVPKWVSLGSVTNGHRMLVRYFRNGESAFSVVRSADVELVDIEIEKTTSVGLGVSPPSRNVRLCRFNIRPAHGSGLYAASNADGIHILGLMGEFSMVDCHFRGLGDDALNIHSMAAEIKSLDSGGKVGLILRGPDRKTERKLPGGWAKAGDRLEIYGQDYSRRGEVDLASYDDKTCTGILNVGGAMPRPGDILVNTAFYPVARIRDCSVVGTRARAFLLQTRGVLIENCLFRGLPSPAIIFAVDFSVWNEAGPTENAVVSGCRFERCARSLRNAKLGAIVVKADHDGGENDRPAGIHRNVRLVGNTFEDCGSCGIYVASTDGVVLDRNTFVRCSSNPNLYEYCQSDIRLKNCLNVNLGRNVSDRDCLLSSDPPLKH